MAIFGSPTSIIMILLVVVKITRRTSGQMTEDRIEQKESAEAVVNKFLEALYDDPFRTETTRTARSLIITSAVCMAVVLFKVNLKSSIISPLDFGERVDVLPMLLALAVLLLLVSFSLRAMTDWLRDREAGLLVTRYVENERIQAAEKSARDEDRERYAEQDEDDYGPYEPSPWWEPYISIKEAADAAVSKAENRIGIRRFPRKLREARKILEIAIPLAFAGLALFLSRGSLGVFLAALITALKT
jgi:hypothetical protein